VQTASLQLSPHYDNSGGITGYDADETVTARISPLGRAGRIISVAATASGNDVSVSGLSFDVVNDAALLATARADAFADARQRAQQYAGLAGRSLGAVQTISEVITQPQDQFATRAAVPGALAASVPIKPGQQPLSVSVTVVWQFAG
jgi:uncharacterized protein